jgi:hypothetical protein
MSGFLLLVTCTFDKTPTDTATTTPTPTPTEQTGDTALRDSAWWRDTGPTTTAPDCPGLVDLRLCAGAITATFPGDSGDSGGSGGGPTTTRCPQVVLRFSGTGQVRVQTYDGACDPTEVILDWSCTAPDEVTIDGEVAAWDDATQTLTTTTWGTVSAAACDPATG